MNDLIKKLASQAYGLCKPIDDEGQQVVLTDQWFEKFAELIVQECVNHCDLLLDHKISSEWSRGTHDCSKAIKQHFGVEE